MFSSREKKSDYKCSYCGRFVPISLQFHHDIRCQSQKKNFENIGVFKYKCKLCGIILEDILDTKRMEHLLFHQSNRNGNINSNIVNNDQTDSDDEQIRNNNANNNNIDMSTITLGGNNENIIFRHQNNNRRNRRNSMDNNYINRNLGLNSSPSDNSNNDSFTSDNQENKSSKDLDNINNNLNYIISNIKDPKKLSENKKKCLICLENFLKGEESIILPCIHMFHSTCIKKWIKIKDFCPLCKKTIKPIKKYKK